MGWLCCFGPSVLVAEAAEVRGHINVPAKFQQAVTDHGGVNKVKVILDGGSYLTLPASDGYFVISNVGPGNHLLQVVHPVLHFDPVMVDVPASADAKKVNAYLHSLGHGKGAKLKYPLNLGPSEMLVFFEPREDFNVLSVFKSPMTLMFVFMAGMMFIMPKLQPMMEEEKARQKAAMGGSQKDSVRDED